MGRRLDGWRNRDHPTESVAGDPATLPAGAHANDADLDYTGSIMPPLTFNEKLQFARWIDLGCPIDTPNPTLKPMGFFADDIKPVLTVSLPRSGNCASGPTITILGLIDTRYP